MNIGKEQLTFDFETGDVISPEEKEAKKIEEQKRLEEIEKQKKELKEARDKLKKNIELVIDYLDGKFDVSILAKDEQQDAVEKQDEASESEDEEDSDDE